MRLVLTILLLFNSILGWSNDNNRPTGMNCDLSSPPENAGEEHIHGTIIKIFPRARDIDNKYTGCQTTWMPDENQWAVLTIVAIESGVQFAIGHRICLIQTFSASTRKAKS